jgi:integrase/recombinase XerD
MDAGGRGTTHRCSRTEMDRRLLPQRRMHAEQKRHPERQGRVAIRAGGRVGKLDLKDYRVQEGRLYVHRLKGSVSAEFKLTDVENGALRAWLRVRGLAPGPLFCSRNHRAIGRRRLDELMKQYCRLARVPEEKAHMHALKHSCGTHVAELLGGDVTAVQDHLGHADIRSATSQSAN